MYRSFSVGKNLSDMFPIKMVWNKEMLSSLLSSLVLYYHLRKFQVNQNSFKINSTIQLLVYVDDVNKFWRESTNNKGNI